MSKTILVVDDSVTVRDFLSDALQELGCTVLCANNGQEGLDLLQGSIHLVVTDLHMPVMDGLQMVAAIKSQFFYKFVPVLMITSDNSVELREQGRRAGVNAWMLKPFTLDKLLHTVKLLARIDAPAS